MLAWEWVPVVEVLACIVPLRMAPTELILLSVPQMMMVKLSNIARESTSYVIKGC